jgi:hypothetical protein
MRTHDAHPPDTATGEPLACLLLHSAPFAPDGLYQLVHGPRAHHDHTGRRQRLNLAREARRVVGVTSERGLGRTHPSLIASLFAAYQPIGGTGA